MNREALDRYCQKGIRVLLLALLVLGPIASGALGTTSTLILEWLTAATLLLWAIRLWNRPQSGLFWPPISWGILVFLLYALGLTWVADVKNVARQELVHLIMYASIFFITANNFSRSDPVKIICFVLIMVGAIIAAYAVYQYVTRSFNLWGLPTGYPGRASGTYINPNHLGGFLEMLVPISLAWAIAGKFKPVARILLTYAACLMIAGIAVTLSRGSWMSFAVSLVALFAVLCLDFRYRAIGLFSLACVLILGVAVVPNTRIFNLRSGKLYSEGKFDKAGRLDTWASTVRMWEDNRWWGVGPGHFSKRFHAYRSEDNQRQPVWAHNDYLNTLAEFGTVGALLAAVVLILLLITFVQSWLGTRQSSYIMNEAGGSNRFAIASGTASGLIAILCHSFVDFNLHVVPNALTASALAGLIASQLRHVSKAYKLRRMLWPSQLAAAMALASVILIVYQAGSGSIQYAWLRKAAHLPAFSTEQAAILTKAFNAQPDANIAWSIAECYRRQSQEGGESYRGMADLNYQKLAQRAMDWYDVAISLNKWDDRAWIGRGWCLDWLDRPGEAEAAYSEAESLDPNGFITAANIGLHYVETHDFAAAREWFARSLRLDRDENPVATAYLGIVNARLLEAATNQFPVHSDRPNGH